MPIAVLCPGCNARLNAPDAAAGKTVKCPKCQAPMVIPGPEPAAPPPAPPPPPKKSGTAPKPPVRQPAAKKESPAELDDDRERKKTRPAEPDDADDRPRKKPRPVEAEDEENDRPRKKSRAVDELDEVDRPRPKRRPADNEDDEDDDRPRKRKPAKSGPPVALLVGGGIAAFLLLIGGAFAAYWFGFRGGDNDTAGGGGGGGGGSGGSGGGGGKAAVPAGWVAVSPPGAGFKAYMPKEPFLAKEKFAPPPPLRQTYIKDYATMDGTFQYQVLVLAFPASVPAGDREKAITDRANAGIPKQFFKEVSRGKAALGGKDATQVVEELDLAGLMAGKPWPGGQKPPSKVVGVSRYLVAGDRGYLAMIAKAEGRPTDAEERGFFDNFEFVSATDLPAEGEVAPKTPDTTATPETAPKPPDSTPMPEPKSNLPAGWKEYTPKDKSFRVALPGPVGELAIGDMTDHICLLPQSGLSVVVRARKGTAAGGKKDPTLDEVIREMSFGKKQVGEKKVVTLAGKPATEVVFEPAIGRKGAAKPQLIGRILKTDTMIYSVWVESTKSGPPPADMVARVFDSFTLLK